MSKHFDNPKLTKVRNPLRERELALLSPRTNGPLYAPMEGHSRSVVAEASNFFNRAMDLASRRVDPIFRAQEMRAAAGPLLASATNAVAAIRKANKEAAEKIKGLNAVSPVSSSDVRTTLIDLEIAREVRSMPQKERESLVRSLIQSPISEESFERDALLRLPSVITGIPSAQAEELKTARLRALYTDLVDEVDDLHLESNDAARFLRETLDDVMDATGMTLDQVAATHPDVAHFYLSTRGTKLRWTEAESVLTVPEAPAAAA